ncbi:MAG TPA: 16S rRNA (guanine(966)-N(2))-methyltransferase RsmD [Magnetospirillum sp.]|jgi:16S rRNA (guanine966-N2)-methyltransferase|nr:16S rRNA (guanine(966)-N(2))-methyltransferase RsmD [Magnetospirillum sp.]
MRIIGGSHKGRRLAAPDGRDTRPTADRARESLFNILAHSDLVELEGALVVDCFAGSGALGLEALSRGAEHAWFLEVAHGGLSALKANVAELKEQTRATILKADATKPPSASRACTLALIDAPYNKELSVPCLAGLADKGWLAPGALVVVEVAAKEPLTPPPGFTVEDERTYGAARLVFLTYSDVA